MTGGKALLPRQDLLLVGRSIRSTNPGRIEPVLVYCVRRLFIATRRPFLVVVEATNHFATKYLHPTEAAPSPSSAKGANIYIFWVGTKVYHGLTRLYGGRPPGFIKSY